MPVVYGTLLCNCYAQHPSLLSHELNMYNEGPVVLTFDSEVQFSFSCSSELILLCQKN